MIARLETIEEIIPIFREYLGWMRQFYTIYNFDAWCEGGIKKLQDDFMADERVIYVFKESESVIGFAMVNQHLRFNRDGFAMAEFYIQKNHGRSGRGRKLAEYIFDRYPGPWEVAVALKNNDARLFWKQVVSSYTAGLFIEKKTASFKGTGFLFNNLSLDKEKSMTNNDILRRVRYIFDFSDSKMMAVFGLADLLVTRSQISDWLKKEDDPAFQELNDTQLSVFLNGLIIDKRGKKEGPQPEPEQVLTNNIIFRKLRIALDLKAEDIIDIMDMTDVHISKPELSAFFRKSENRHYRVCKDQVLRNFLKGVQLKYRPQI